MNSAPTTTTHLRGTRIGAWIIVALLALGGLALVAAVNSQAAPGPSASAATAAILPAAPDAPTPPTPPTPPTSPAGDQGLVSVFIDGDQTKPSGSIVVLLGITLLSVAPALLLMMTSFTKIFVVLALTRNAIGMTTAPPNQVLAGLAIFLSLFIMGPILTEVNTLAVQPFMDGSIDFGAAIELASGPLREFMLGQTRESDIALMTRISDNPNPDTAASTPMLTLIPAFMISELRAAFIIGFVIFVPFLIVDLVVASSLMSMGMMMLPPVMVSLPFKLLLFVLVDGWALIITTLVGTYL